MDLQQTTPGTPRVLIIGGGFGGTQLAKKLKGQPVEVLMLDRHNYHTFQPLLYQVAMGAIEADAIGFPIRRIFNHQKNFTFHLADVQRINPETNTVTTNIGDIKYDYLVIATGANTNFFGNNEIEHFTMPMKNIPEALNIRSLVLQNIEKALVTADKEERNALLTFVIVGGGPTGVELSGALAEMRLHALSLDYPGLKPEDMKVYIAEGKPELLAAMSEGASKKAKQYLEDKGVIIYNDVHVTSYDGNLVKIDNGVNIRTRNVFWAAGVRGEVPDGLPKEVVGKGARIVVDEINRIKGFQNIFAIGDVAAMITPDTPNGHPGVAPAAMQQGKHLAKNIINIINNKPTQPFKYLDKGTMATVGRNQAVADIRKLKFQGFFAWVLWLFVHIMSLAGFTNKLIVFLSWAVNYFTKNSDNRMIVRYFDTKTMMADPISK
ncbi:NAD(P)/FAD-dependent oxidoreductase [Mucilaginibacter sp. RS28]|uniref:NADH:ubiquinone reductase (non-electrogenic) n=1 Tax=Mucilaginibacter straminoryzae TaxID=2932774 RepID=A0A9X1X8C5_9SPHI|nr:NAD(P)/FAD-dependent oxidoreductase [Mucilaginibacter straminoryzae]MCJ8211558.1 NAD(P)/FAD-dependent oxidoreductase [Mucilaginibacter straminoryzae]